MPQSGKRPAGMEVTCLRCGSRCCPAQHQPASEAHPGHARRCRAESLGRWRRRVAESAGKPSRPIPLKPPAKCADAFDEDLNTVAALAVLHDVESGHDMPAGAKFETFAFVDRVLGLELTREIGHQ